MFISIIIIMSNFTVCRASEIPFDIQDSNLVWKKHILNVYIQENPQIIKELFEDWNNKSGKLYTFNYIDNYENADISLFVKDKSYNTYGALTIYFHNDKNILQAHIILPKKIFNGNFINTPIGIFVIKHEIGHALGIFKHSTDKSDIMYPYKTDMNNDITQNDIKLLKNARSDKQMKNKPLPSEEYKYNLPYLADIYKKSGRYNKAIEIYDSILKDNPKLTLAIYSKGYCYYKLKKYDVAELYFKTAYEKENNNLIYLNSYIKLLCITGKKKLAEQIFYDFLKNNPQTAESELVKNSLKILNKY